MRRILFLATLALLTSATSHASIPGDVVMSAFTVPDGVVAKLATLETDFVRSIVVVAVSSETLPAHTLVETASCTATRCDITRSIAPASALTVQNGALARLRLDSSPVGPIDLVFEAEPRGDRALPAGWGCKVYGGARTTPQLFARTTGAISNLTTAGSSIVPASLTGHAGEQDARIGHACGAILHEAVAGYYGGIPSLAAL